MQRTRRAPWAMALLAGLATALATVMVAGLPTQAAVSQLTRYPYLTDTGQTQATIDWATDRSQTSGYATYGEAGHESCTAHRANASKTSITVDDMDEYQWKAQVSGLSADATYCYRVFFSDPVVDLLRSDASPQFSTMPKGGGVMFAVIGDWGVISNDEADLMGQLSHSPAQFILGAGDTAYNNGSQTNYGDLHQTGDQVSEVFRPTYYARIGLSRPLFNALGNHGRTATHLLVWPEQKVAATSGGTYTMQKYCCVNNTKSANYPSAWYAFNAGRSRIYVLDATWSAGNLGSGTLYSDDDAAHWSSSSAEYQWLAGDLAAHPGGLKIAVFHFPMYGDNPTEGTDHYLHGPGSLGALLTKYGVQLVFNGHMHAYQRNTHGPGESFVSYTDGGGGGTLEPVGTNSGGCSANDAYAIGWSPTKLKGYACGATSPPTSSSQVINYLLVTVRNSSVTVTPTNSRGNTFDVQTYSF